MTKLLSQIEEYYQRAWSWLKNILQSIEIKQVACLFLSILIFTLFISPIIYYLEIWQAPNGNFHHLYDAFWWAIVTVTTVGYGDIYPITVPGRLVAILIILFGTALLSILNGLVVNAISDRKMKQEQGILEYNCKDHIILCEWNYRAKQIIQELRSNHKNKKNKIVLIANIERKPIDDKNVLFVQGNVNEETLKQANLKQANTVIILGDDKLDDTSRDAKVVLSTLTIEKTRREVYTIAEIVNEQYYEMCKKAYADEVIVSSNFSSHLIANTTINRGISKVVSRMLSDKRDNNQLKKRKVLENEMNSRFIDVFMNMKQDKQSIVIAIQKGEEGEVIFNPSSNYTFKADDYLIMISQ